MIMREEQIRKKAINNLSKKRAVSGGPKFIGGKSPSAGSVLREGKKIVDGAKKIGSSIGSVAGKVGNAIKNTVHDDTFPTPQRRAYLKKKNDDAYKNSEFLKQRLKLGFK